MTQPRTILFLCDDPDDLGGVQRVLATLVDQFEAVGYRVVVTSLFLRDATGFVRPEVERTLLFRQGPLARLVQRFRLGPLHLQGRRILRVNKLAQRRAKQALRRQVRDLAPDAVIVFDSFMAKLAAEALLTGTKVLVQYHNSYSSVSKTADFARLRTASHGVSAFLGLTAQDGELFRTAGFARAGYISNPVSFYPDTLPEKPSHRVIALGRYHRQKAFDHLVAAWAAVPRKGDWRLDIYGEGPERGLIQQTVDRLGVGGSAVIHPPTWEAERLLSDSGIYVLSSRFEGFGMVLVEAMACGVALVSTRCGPGPEELTQGCGLLTDIGDIAGIADAIQTLIDDAALRSTFAEAGRRRAMEYRVDAIVEQWQTLIETAPPVR
ncbi:hypothetical protein ASG37_16480 [Sphingomonas sp. Leaf407]|uniref:glycosyltransferase n=1 Tax=unclassified Sphingomonas TaxID=196159 RepID=UPI0006FFE67D|nr:MULTISPECIES: glycosyltransferase [unclassified Sphingomonas]KQN33747.1 hypothetical protein ASE97_16470 [Sphingomonas sp. Leaf42]KQT25028.1 hypothetical protein ASG37_16480 [Sphingomonas sp. Leaf407]